MDSTILAFVGAEIPTDDKQFLERAATGEDKSISALIREAIFKLRKSPKYIKYSKPLEPAQA